MSPSSKSCTSRRDAHVNFVQPAHAGERAAIFFPFLHVAFAICGTDDERVITGCGGSPLGFPEGPCQIATGIVNLRVTPGLAIVEAELDAGDAAVAAVGNAF